MRLPIPGSSAASWTVYKARVKLAFKDADPRVVAAFWLFGGCSGIVYPGKLTMDR
jgi:battenin